MVGTEALLQDASDPRRSPEELERNRTIERCTARQGCEQHPEGTSLMNCHCPCHLQPAWLRVQGGFAEVGVGAGAGAYK